MKEFYTSRSTTLENGTYRGRRYRIGTNSFGAPVAYVQVFDEDREETVSNPDGILAHIDTFEYFPYECTYYGKAYWNDNDPNTYAGWDHMNYAVYCQALNGMPGYDGRRYTFDEVLNEVKMTIDLILERREQYERIQT